MDVDGQDSHVIPVAVGVFPDLVVQVDAGHVGVFELNGDVIDPFFTVGGVERRLGVEFVVRLGVGVIFVDAEIEPEGFVEFNGPPGSPRVSKSFSVLMYQSVPTFLKKAWASDPTASVLLKSWNFSVMVGVSAEMLSTAKSPKSAW